MNHCCQQSHYSYQIKKCGNVECTICKLVRMDLDKFSSLDLLTHPVPGVDDQYKSFDEVYQV